MFGAWQLHLQLLPFCSGLEEAQVYKHGGTSVGIGLLAQLHQLPNTHFRSKRPSFSSSSPTKLRTPPLILSRLDIVGLSIGRNC